MKLIFFLLMIFSIQNLQAQKDSLQKEINEQVWKPFIKAFIEADTDGFMAVHSKDLHRVIQDSRMIQSYDDYYLSNRRGNERAKQNNRKRDIELRFTQRIASKGRAFEVGYFKTSSISPEGKKHDFYGEFHVLLRKEDGKWMILMDADASEKTDETIFDAAEPMK